MWIALTRAVSPKLGDCELTHLPRVPIDVERARAQHAAYEAALGRRGVEVVRLPEAPALPDAVFVEDTALVTDEVAVLTRPGAASRRPETASVAPVLESRRDVIRIEAPGTLEGGDVLRVDRTFYVGETPRSNAEGIAQLRRLLQPFDFEVRAVAVRGCLHLKSAVTSLGEGRVLANPDWFDTGALTDVELVPVDVSEPHAANCLAVGDFAIVPRGAPRTAEKIEGLGLAVESVDVTELQKAEAGVTCMSLLLRAGSDL